MTVRYEWDIELIDEYGDILDHNFSDKLADIWEDMLIEPKEGYSKNLVLVRNKGNDIEGLLDRHWAYYDPASKTLPETFGDSLNEPTEIKVPKKYHTELNRILKGK